MKIRKIMVSTLALVLMAGFAVGCAGTTTPVVTTTKAPTAATTAGTTVATTTGTTAAPKPYELSVSWWGGDARHKKTLDMIAAYIGLFGTMARTGLMFVVSGVFLIVFGVYLEKKRRKLMAQIKTAPSGKESQP